METLVIGAISRSNEAMAPKQCCICQTVVFLSSEKNGKPACVICGMELLSRSSHPEIRLSDSKEAVDEMVQERRLAEAGKITSS